MDRQATGRHLRLGEHRKLLPPSELTMPSALPVGRPWRLLILPYPGHHRSHAQRQRQFACGRRQSDVEQEALVVAVDAPQPSSLLFAREHHVGGVVDQPNNRVVTAPGSGRGVVGCQDGVEGHALIIQQAVHSLHVRLGRAGLGQRRRGITRERRSHLAEAIGQPCVAEVRVREVVEERGGNGRVGHPDD